MPPSLPSSPLSCRALLVIYHFFSSFPLSSSPRKRRKRDGYSIHDDGALLPSSLPFPLFATRRQKRRRRIEKRRGKRRKRERKRRLGPHFSSSFFFLALNVDASVFFFFVSYSSRFSSRSLSLLSFLCVWMLFPPFRQCFFLGDAPFSAPATIKTRISSLPGKWEVEFPTFQPGLLSRLHPNATGELLPEVNAQAFCRRARPPTFSPLQEKRRGSEGEGGEFTRKTTRRRANAPAKCTSPLHPPPPPCSRRQLNHRRAQEVPRGRGSLLFLPPLFRPFALNLSRGRGGGGGRKEGARMTPFTSKPPPPPLPPGLPGPAYRTPSLPSLRLLFQARKRNGQKKVLVSLPSLPPLSFTA